MPSPSETAELIRDQAAAWSSITAPNPVGERLAESLADVVRDVAALRGALAFEQEPASFLSALQETKETAP